MLVSRIPIILACVLAGGCSASPEEVCGHIEELVEQEIDAEAARQAVDGCEFKWNMRKDTKGLLQYKELADCVMDADSIDALTECR